MPDDTFSRIADDIETHAKVLEDTAASWDDLAEEYDSAELHADSCRSQAEWCRRQAKRIREVILRAAKPCGCKGPCNCDLFERLGNPPEGSES